MRLEYRGSFSLENGYGTHFGGAVPGKQGGVRSWRPATHEVSGGVAGQR